MSKDTAILQRASNDVSTSGVFGTWAFLPVTDGHFVKSAPSETLFEGLLNGANLLTSNVAEESVPYVPQNINTEAKLTAWIRLVFPLFSDDTIADLYNQYAPSNGTQFTAKIPQFATSGSSDPTALDTSGTATGYQQTANVIYAESTFICSSYWLVNAHNARKGHGYKMQYSVPIAIHGYDNTAVLGNTPLPSQSDALVRAMQKIIGNFVKTGNPSDVTDDWTAYVAPNFPMLNLNQTGGQILPVNTTDVVINSLGALWYVEPGLRKDFKVVNGSAWEGGRGARCDFWRRVAGRVPM
jgi:carboxylesterase type B